MTLGGGGEGGVEGCVGERRGEWRGAWVRGGGRQGSCCSMDWCLFCYDIKQTLCVVRDAPCLNMSILQHKRAAVDRTTASVVLCLDLSKLQIKRAAIDRSTARADMRTGDLCVNIWLPHEREPWTTPCFRLVPKSAVKTSWIFCSG